MIAQPPPSVSTPPRGHNGLTRCQGARAKLLRAAATKYLVGLSRRDHNGASSVFKSVYILLRSLNGF